MFLVAYFANIDTDQTAPLGSSLIRIHSICFHEKKSSLKYTRICAADIKRSNDIFRAKNSGGLRVKNINLSQVLL